MELISAALAPSDSPLPGIVLLVDRQKLAKRLWRGIASDGMEFGFELSAPLKHADVFFQNDRVRYIIEQIAEPVVEVALEMTSSAAAGIGWAIGNLHLELSADATRLLAPDEPAVRQLLDRLKVSYNPTTAIFRPAGLSAAIFRPMNLDPVTNTNDGAPGGGVPPHDAGWIVGLLQAGDSFYPTGSYAHSFGLEGLVQENVVRDRATLREFIFQSVLPSLQRVELPLAAHAWQAFGSGDWQKIAELCSLSSALKPSQELRAASANIGRQRAELGALLRSNALATEYLNRARAADWPFSAAISAALEGCMLGAPQVAVLSGMYYATIASLLSAAMKVLRLGQNAAQSLLTEALAAAPAVITAATEVPIDEIGWFNPWLDIAAARHETADARMFIS